MKGLLLNGNIGESNEMIVRPAWHISKGLYRGFGINTAPACGLCEPGLYELDKKFHRYWSADAKGWLTGELNLCRQVFKEGQKFFCDD